jgi:CheY-like chemotaxis protein
LTINPDSPFSRPERVVEILARALNDTRKLQAVIIDPDSDRSSALGAHLEHRGISFSTVRTGREGFELAASRMDVQLIAIHINSVRWPLSQTVSNLRADARTAAIPMIVYGPGFQEANLMPLIQRTSRSIYIPNDLAEYEKLRMIQRFRQSLGETELTSEQRREQTLTAAAWLSAIASGKLTTEFDLGPAEAALSNAASDPPLTQHCLNALGAIPSKSSQEAIFSVALNEHLDAPLREAAANLLASHIRKFSWLLGKRDAVELKLAWEREGDAGVAAALADVLDMLRTNSSRIASESGRDLPPNR